MQSVFARCRSEPPPLIHLVRELTQRLDLVVSPRDAFLGAGAVGSVFSVLRRSGDRAAVRQPLALKVFADAKWAHISHEFQVLRSAAERGAPVIPPIPDSLCLLGVSGAGGGFLLASVRSRVEVSTVDRCIAVFSALFGLHSHAVVHGDARLSNLLSSPLAWIDLQEAVLATGAEQHLSAMAKRDAAMLAFSVLTHRGCVWRAVLDEAVEAYDVKDERSAHALAEAVWRATTLACN